MGILNLGIMLYLLVRGCIERRRMKKLEAKKIAIMRKRLEKRIASEVKKRERDAGLSVLSSI